MRSVRRAIKEGLDERHDQIWWGVFERSLEVLKARLGRMNDIREVLEYDMGIEDFEEYEIYEVLGIANVSDRYGKIRLVNRYGTPSWQKAFDKVVRIWSKDVEHNVGPLVSKIMYDPDCLDRLWKLIEEHPNNYFLKLKFERVNAILRQPTKDIVDQIADRFEALGRSVEI